MKKHLPLVLLSLMMWLTVAAQKNTDNGMSVNLSAESLIPSGRIATNYSAGFGASLKLELPIAQSLNFVAGAGYSALFYTDALKQELRSLNDNSSGDGFAILQGGFKYYMTPQFYAEGSAGYILGTRSGTGSYFSYAPGVGIIIPVEFGNAIDIGANYNGWRRDGYTISFIGLHAGFKFGL